VKATGLHAVILSEAFRLAKREVEGRPSEAEARAKPPARFTTTELQWFKPHDRS
jgi:hypothetical protein